MDTRWNTTSFGNHDKGMKLHNAIIGDQTNRGNNFAGGNIGTDAWFVGNVNDMQFSQIRTNPSLMTNGLNNIIVPIGTVASDWFTLAGTDINCQSSNFCGETPYAIGDNPNGGELTLTDINIAGVNNETMLDELMKWETQRYLYKKLKANPSFISYNAEINTFFNQHENGKINDFYRVSDEIRNLFFSSSDSPISIEGLQTDAKNLSEGIDAIQEELLTASVSEKPSLLQAKKDKVNELLPILDDVHNVRLLQKQQRYQKAVFLLKLNQELTPENVFQSNEKIMNQVYLETIGMDNYDFSEHQQKIINSIADQCERVGGKAVLSARALQQFYLIKYYDLEHGCNYSNARIGKTEEQKIQISPNPTMGQFSIQFEYPTEENLDLEFYDMNGRLLFQDKLFRGEYSYSFENLNLESGIYICKLKSAIGNVFTRKVVINKL